MSWTCPTCKRVLPGPNQFHSCYITNKDAHLKKMSENIQEVFETLLSHLNSFENIEILYLKTCIQFKIGATFLSIYPKKDRLELEFQLNREEDFFPVYKCKRISKNRVLHSVAVEDMDEVDTQLINWLQDAYNTIRK